MDKQMNRQTNKHRWERNLLAAGNNFIDFYVSVTVLWPLGLILTKKSFRVKWNWKEQMYVNLAVMTVGRKWHNAVFTYSAIWHGEHGEIME